MIFSLDCTTWNEDTVFDEKLLSFNQKVVGPYNSYYALTKQMTGHISARIFCQNVDYFAVVV